MRNINFDLSREFSEKNVEDVYLYDLKNDPYENNNISKNNQDTTEF